MSDNVRLRIEDGKFIEVPVKEKSTFSLEEINTQLLCAQSGVSFSKRYTASVVDGKLTITRPLEETLANLKAHVSEINKVVSGPRCISITDHGTIDSVTSKGIPPGKIIGIGGSFNTKSVFIDYLNSTVWEKSLKLKTIKARADEPDPEQKPVFPDSTVVSPVHTAAVSRWADLDNED